MENITEARYLKIDIVKYFPGFYTHKQIEKRGDFLFIRVKKRKLPLAV